ncbi:hypothetical protein L7F22_057870 [Adiantum nelumboides]|nr:hypothetical protein [Adiantum nelumboides]
MRGSGQSCKGPNSEKEKEVAMAKAVAWLWHMRSGMRDGGSCSGKGSAWHHEYMHEESWWSSCRKSGPPQFRLRESRFKAEATAAISSKRSRMSLFPATNVVQMGDALSYTSALAVVSDRLTCTLSSSPSITSSSLLSPLPPHHVSHHHHPHHGNTIPFPIAPNQSPTHYRPLHPKSIGSVQRLLHTIMKKLAITGMSTSPKRLRRRNTGGHGRHQLHHHHHHHHHYHHYFHQFDEMQIKE